MSNPSSSLHSVGSCRSGILQRPDAVQLQFRAAQGLPPAAPDTDTPARASYTEAISSTAAAEGILILETTMHRYTVELRIVSQTLDPDEVTRVLGLVPTRVARKGEPKVDGGTSQWTANMWGFEVLPPGKDDWSSLSDGIQALLRIFGPIRDRLHAYSRGNKIYLWCGHFTSSFDGGPTLSPALLKALGDFGVQLVLDTYSERADKVAGGGTGGQERVKKCRLRKNFPGRA